MNEPDVRPTLAPLTWTAASAETTAAPEAAVPTLDPTALPLEEPGRYVLQGLLGAGGQAVVYVARDLRLGRAIAFKRLRDSVDDASRDSELADRERRFVREAQITAQLDHPGIAPIHEVGRQADGALYATQKLVRGRTLAATLGELRAPAERLTLVKPLLAACQAVAYAHARSVVHRDLKPGNIMLGELGEVVVLDWGLARSLAAEPEHERGVRPDDPNAETSSSTGPVSGLLRSERTSAGALLGTPHYMSPEQARREPDAVDRRSDVWSLGVVLYEILAGTRPFGGDRSGEVLAQVVAGPIPSLRKRAPHAPPELVAIAERALQRDPAARYEDAAGLAADLERFLDGRLVLAHAYTAAQHLRRWVRRHAVAVATAAVFTLALAILAAISGVRIVSERDRANREAKVSRRVADFVTRMFEVAKPSAEAQGKEITAREVIDAAVAELEGKGLEQDPELRAQLLQVLARTYFSIGRYAQARALATRAVTLHEEALGEEHPETLAARALHALTFVAVGRPFEAARLLRELVPIEIRVLGPRHPETLQSRRRLADALTTVGRLEEAEVLARETIEDLRAVHGEESQPVAVALNSFATLLGRQKKLAECERALVRAIAIQTKLAGREDPETLRALNNLGQVYIEQRRFREAEVLLRETLAAKRRVLGPQHPSTLFTARAQAETLLRVGGLAEAAKLAEETLPVARRVLGEARSITLELAVVLGAALRRQDRLREALPLLRGAVDGLRAARPSDPDETAKGELELACAKAAEGHGDEAVELLSAAVHRGLAAEALADALREPAWTALRADPRLRALDGKVRAPSPR